MSFPDEKAKAKSGKLDCSFYAEGLKESAEFRQAYKERMKNVIKADEMPFERSPDGLIKHIIHEKMDTKECCIDAYMQFIGLDHVLHALFVGSTKRPKRRAASLTAASMPRV